MNKYTLFVDELGIANPKETESDIYVLTGVAVKNDLASQLGIEADHIKFKYWNRTNIIFHSREIGKNLNEFIKFDKDEKLLLSFRKDLLGYLSRLPVTVFSVVIDKEKARENKWNSEKILKESIRFLYFNFLTFLLGKESNKGRIVIESATAEKDVYYLKYFAYFTSPNCKELNVDYKVAQNILTSISFVTKRNSDIEEQIADLFSYAGKCKYSKDIKKVSFASNSYEDKIIKILNNKLFTKPKESNVKKLKFYEKVESFVVLPKK